MAVEALTSRCRMKSLLGEAVSGGGPVSHSAAVAAVPRLASKVEPMISVGQCSQEERRMGTLNGPPKFLGEPLDVLKAVEGAKGV